MYKRSEYNDSAMWKAPQVLAGSGAARLPHPILTLRLWPGPLVLGEAKGLHPKGALPQGSLRGSEWLSRTPAPRD